MLRLDTSSLHVLRAVAGMGLLTFVMALWMSVTRAAAMNREGIALDAAAHTEELRPRLPSRARRVSDNYNHLFEAPTVFYAVALSIVVAGLADQTHAVCAWAFLIFRIAHSLVQATFNAVLVRAIAYGLSWAALATMIVRTSLQL